GAREGSVVSSVPMEDRRPRSRVLVAVGLIAGLALVLIVLHAGRSGTPTRDPLVQEPAAVPRPSESPTADLAAAAQPLDESALEQGRVQAAPAGDAHEVKIVDEVADWELPVEVVDDAGLPASGITVELVGTVPYRGRGGFVLGTGATVVSASTDARG